MRPPRYMALVNKAVQASLAAIEIYNKPDFQYREETFSILMLNTWELLLKARVVKENGGRFRAIEIWETVPRKDGAQGKRLRPRKNRSGNIMTIGLGGALGQIRGFANPEIDDRCAENLLLLTEIRDNAVHLRNVSAGLAQRIQEVGSAALRNFVRAAERWFDYNLDRFNFYIMPIAFHAPASVLESLGGTHHTVAVGNLLRRISDSERAHPSDETADFNVTLKIEVRFMRAIAPEAIPVRTSRAPDAVPVVLTEEDIRNRYPWVYRDLTSQLKDRYQDFKLNRKFWDIKKELEKSGRHSSPRYLDPGNPKSGKKTFYSTGILQEFDKHYIRKGGAGR